MGIVSVNEIKSNTFTVRNSIEISEKKNVVQ